MDLLRQHFRLALRALWRRSWFATAITSMIAARHRGERALVAAVRRKYRSGDVVVAPAALALVALLACWISARQATRIDPNRALRYE